MYDTIHKNKYDGELFLINFNVLSVYIMFYNKYNFLSVSLFLFN